NKRLAVPTWDGSLWVYDAQRNTRIKIVDGENFVTDSPLWTPDGSRVVFSGFPEGGGSNLFWQRADGSGTPELLVEDVAEKHASSWTTDGKELFYTWFAGQGSSRTHRIYLYSVEKKEKPKILMEAPWLEVDVSPDGQWLAYSSAETDTFQI